MKKTIMTIVLLATVSGAYSQTKEETEKWIMEKINLYKQSEVTVTLENGYFQIHRDYEISHKYSFPVWAIKNAGIAEWNSRYLEYKFSECFECYWTHENSINSKDKGTTNKATNAVIDLKLAGEPEEGFSNRFNKAIQHLKTFYPKFVKKETF